MKKYITTDKHPVYRSGLRIEQKHDNCFHLLGTENELYLNAVGYVINIWLNNKWIEEIQEKEFTKDNMIEFAERCIEQYRGGLYGTSTEFAKYVKTNNLKTK